MSTIKRVHDAFVAKVVIRAMDHAPIEQVKRHALRTATIDATRKGKDPSRVGFRADAKIATLKALAAHSILNHGHFSDGKDADAKAFDKAQRNQRGEMMGKCWADQHVQGGFKKQKIKAKDYSHVANRIASSQDVFVDAASRKVANARKCARLHDQASNAEARRDVKRLARAMRHAGNL